MKPAASNDACGPALLVAQTSFLGDVVLTTPLVSALRRRLMPRRLALLVPVAPEAARRAAALVPPGPGPLVGVAPGSVWATKRWAPEGFAAVIAALAAEGARCVVLGAPDEAALAEEIDRLAGGRATVLAGRTDLATLVAVVDRLALLVANDSAPMHIACARGVPVVGVFCATTPALGYGPWGPRAAVVEADLACRPCA